MSSKTVVAINTLSVSEANEGIRTSLTGLVAALARRGRHRLLLVCSAHNRHLFVEPSSQVEVLSVALGTRARVARRLFADQVTVPRLVAARADVLVTPSSVGALRCPIPQVVIVQAHLAVPSMRKAAGLGALATLHRLYYGPLLRHSLRHADAVVGISQHLTAAVIAELGVPASSTYTVPLGVDLPPGPPLPRSQRRPTILFVGTLYEYKDAAVAIRAFARARSRLPDAARLLVVGRDPDGTQSERLQRVATDEGVLGAVDLLGAVDGATLTDLYRRSSVFVLPSRSEGFGLPVLEAMSHGTPSIVADATSLPEVLAGTGATFASGDAEALARELVAVFASDERWSTMSRAARRRAEACTWAASAEALAAVVDKVAP